MIGRTLGNRYKIYDKVGGGGMAEVFLARDTKTGEIVALKILRDQYTEGTDYVERFQREAKSAMKLSHPNICMVKDFGDDDQTYYMVLEFIEGKTLSSVIEEKGPLPVDVAVSYIKQAALALGEAYRSGIIAHRDVKSQNIMVNPSGQIKMMDFGIAKSRDFATMTTAGSFVGTPEYMSPEQAQGGKVDSRSDMYSLGVVLYEMLAGEVPFEADTPWGVLNMHISKEAFPLTNLRSDIPEGLVEIIKRMMAKDPDYRFQNPNELVQALDIVMKSYKTPRNERVKSKKIPRSNPKLKRKVRNVAIGVVSAVVIAGLGYVFFILSSPNPASAFVKSEPKGASVFLKGPDDDEFQKLSNADSEIKELYPGKYTLKLELDGYKTHEQQFRMESGKNLDLGTIKLAKQGLMKILTSKVDWGKVSDVPGAFSVSIANTGESEIEIERSFTGDWIIFDQEPFIIQPNEQKQIRVAVNPEKVSPGKSYSATVIFKPKNSSSKEVSIPITMEYAQSQGRPSSVTDNNPPPVSNQTDTKPKPGNSGENTGNSGSTTPPPPVKTTATVYITSNVPGAFIYIDGSAKGTTPSSVTLAPGTHKIEVRMARFKSYSETINVSAGDEKTVNVVLRNK
ncbi:MAG: protein kinase [Caldisericales bacterium]|jgi:serine/threonine protein kinase|nr:protein kinase [bacterium]